MSDMQQFGMFVPQPSQTQAMQYSQSQPINYQQQSFGQPHQLQQGGSGMQISQNPNISKGTIEMHSEEIIAILEQCRGDLAAGLQYFIVDVNQFIPNAAPKPKPSPKGKSSAQAEKMDNATIIRISARNNPNESYKSLVIRNNVYEKLCGSLTYNYGASTTYNLCIQKYRNGRKYFGDDGTPIPGSNIDKRDVSMAVYAFELLNDHVNQYIAYLMASGVIRFSTKPYVAGQPIPVPKEELGSVLQRSTKAGTIIHNCILRMKLKNTGNEFKIPTYVKVRGKKNEKEEVKLTVENIEQIIPQHSSIKFNYTPAIVFSPSNGLFMMSVYINALCIDQPSAADTTKSAKSFDSEDEQEDDKRGDEDDEYHADEHTFD